jgi:diazepam-binding inhibitor (GABA receptor modulating acyl-CoA-binding protein)
MNQKELFESAVIDSKELPYRPDNEILLHLYSLYKQATEGDVNIAPPGMFEFIAKAKYDAWLKFKGIIPADAMQRYIDLVAELYTKK